MPAKTTLRFVAGDPLRAIAALAVVLFHVGLFSALLTADRPGGARMTDVYGDVAGSIFAMGQLGIYVFFVLSGFLIARPFVAAFIKRSAPPALRGYALARVFRIVPLFWFVAAVTLLRYGPEGASAREVVALFGFAQSYDESILSEHIGQAWTLGVEMMFYAAVPVVALALWPLRHTLGERGRFWLVMALAGAIAAVTLATVGDVRPAEAVRPHESMYALMPGVMLAAIGVRQPSWLTHRRMPFFATVLALGGVAGLVLHQVVLERGTLSSFGTLGLIHAPACAAIVGGALFYQWSGHGAWRVLDNAPLHWLGARSYSIYLTHGFVLAQLNTIIDEFGSAWEGAAVLAGLGVPLTILASDLTYRYVELPFLALRDRLRGPRHAPEVVLPAPAVATAER